MRLPETRQEPEEAGRADRLDRGEQQPSRGEEARDEDEQDHHRMGLRP